MPVIFLRRRSLLNLQGYFTEIIRRLFTWVEGFFRFEGEMLPPDDRINVRLDLENIIIEGSRQLREWEQLQDEIPSLDMALKFTDRPLKNVNLSVEEWRGCFLHQSQKYNEADRADEQDERS